MKAKTIDVRAFSLALSLVAWSDLLGQNVPQPKSDYWLDIRPRFKTLPTKTAGARNLIVLIHGWNSDINVWPAGMQAAIAARLGAGAANWDIWLFDWNRNSGQGNGVLASWLDAPDFFAGEAFARGNCAFRSIRTPNPKLSDTDPGLSDSCRSVATLWRDC